MNQHIKKRDNNNINYICNLLNADGYMLSNDEVEQCSRSTISQMEYNSVIHAISKQWLQYMQEKTLK